MTIFHRYAIFPRQRRLVLAAALLATIAARGLGAEETLVIDSSLSVGSSPRQWVYEGSETAKGPAGPEIVISPAALGGAVSPELYLSFDGEAPVDAAGRWNVETVGPVVRSADARFGPGSGVFRAPATKLVIQPSSGAVFAPNVPLGDLSLEFWLKPTRADSGEIVFLWKASRQEGKAWLSQQISCIVMRNRVAFGFLNFFGAPGGKPTTVNLQGSTILVPGAWSHHLVRFDSSTGLLEYAMNGDVEAVAYVTSTGKQSGTVYNPVPGGSGRLELGQNYTGLIDEFRIVPAFVDEPRLRRFPAAGATATSPIIDLGSTNSRLSSISAVQRTPGESAVHWSYRLGDSQAGWRDEEPAWTPFAAGAQLAAGAEAPRGRYLQLRMELFPDAKGERSPAIGSIGVRFEPDRPPSPPSSLSAAVGDGRIQLRWTSVSEADIAGYVVYYGLSSGDYFGRDAAEGPSPIFVPGAKTAGLTLNGLKNGALYFIAVAAYDGAKPPHVGETTRELSARPSRVSP